MKKRITAILLALCMVAVMLPAGVLAADTEVYYQGAEFMPDGGTAFGGPILKFSEFWINDDSSQTIKFCDSEGNPLIFSEIGFSDDGHCFLRPPADGGIGWTFTGQTVGEEFITLTLPDGSEVSYHFEVRPGRGNSGPSDGPTINPDDLPGLTYVVLDGQPGAFTFPAWPVYQRDNLSAIVGGSTAIALFYDGEPLDASLVTIDESIMKLVDVMDSDDPSWVFYEGVSAGRTELTYQDGTLYAEVTDQTPPNVPHFTEEDHPSDWAMEVVTRAIEEGLVPPEMQHDYQKDISRGDVAKLFVNLLSLSANKPIQEILAENSASPDLSTFSDTTEMDVLALNALGVINGIGGGKYGPSEPLQRAQIAAIINRIAHVMGVETDGYTHEFTDVAGHWCSPELGWPVHAGIINGIGNNLFDPNTNLNTEQAIKIAYQAYLVLKAE